MQEVYNNDEFDSEIDGVVPYDYESRDLSRQAVADDDELYYTGYDLGRQPTMRHALHNDYWDGEDDIHDNKDAALVRSALDRIEKARTKGKTNVSLTSDEMAALGRRNGKQQPETSPQLISPPVTPHKSSKTMKSSSRSNSLSNMVVAKTRRKGDSPKAKPRSNSKAKLIRRESTEAVPIFHPTSNSVLVQGPDGVPVYAPLVYSAPGFDEPLTRSRSHEQRYEHQVEQPSVYAQRHVSQQQRPSSSSAAYSRHDPDYYVPQPRARSGSSSVRPPDDHGRRNVSGPPDVSFSTLRRVPPASSPLVPRNQALISHSYSDPSVAVRRGSAKFEVESPSSSSSEDQGVRVDILPSNTGAGYTISRKPVKESDSGKRKKSRR